MHRNLFVTVILLVSLALGLGACTAGGTTQAPTTPVPAPADASGTGVTVKAESPVLVESARTLPAVLAEKDPWFAALSPNGATIAYYIETGRGKDRTSQICIYTFDGAGKKCHICRPIAGRAIPTSSNGRRTAPPLPSRRTRWNSATMPTSGSSRSPMVRSPSHR